MSVASPTARPQAHRRTRLAVVLGTTVALGTGILLAPNAFAYDKYGPGYSIPDSAGHAGASHLGAFGKPGSLFPHAIAHAYCADPTLPGPAAGGKYSPITPFKSWTSKATGKKVSSSDFNRAAFVLSDTRQPTDAQAAAVDAVIYTYLNRGSDYALPNGKRALERLSYKNVPASVKTLANTYMQEAERFAGPYRVNIHAGSKVSPGAKVPVTLDITSATGHKLPNTKLDLKVSGAASGTGSVTTNIAGTARTTITASKSGTINLQATAARLPSTTLHAQTPGNGKAQRVVVAGGHSTATATAHLKATTAHGGLKVVKTAADNHKVMVGVEFEVKDRHGKTVARGKTDAHGVWQVKDLAPGSYTVHEVRAAEGYRLAPDQRVSVGDLVTAKVSVTDTKVPQKPAPRPRPVHLPGNVLPKTGA
ncbi:SpaA isopeptide-forming pilin-related protein [Streptomyces sp. Edi2]|uniref:MSCRAMM family protein n=1 Tax=Streptomyces sp. Edi2 TaxID=3162528 RepID=UPI003305A422